MKTLTQQRILNAIEAGHRFSIGLDGEQNAIHKDYLRKQLPDVRIENLNTALFELREAGKVDFDFNKDCNIIYLT